MRRSHKSGCASPVILDKAGVITSDMPDFGNMKYKAARRPCTRPRALGPVHLDLCIWLPCTWKDRDEKPAPTQDAPVEVMRI
jgi:hypothetical protein